MEDLNQDKNHDIAECQWPQERVRLIFLFFLGGGVCCFPNPLLCGGVIKTPIINQQKGFRRGGNRKKKSRRRRSKSDRYKQNGTMAPCTLFFLKGSTVVQTLKNYTLSTRQPKINAQAKVVVSSWSLWRDACQTPEKVYIAAEPLRAEKPQPQSWIYLLRWHEIFVDQKRNWKCAVWNTCETDQRKRFVCSVHYVLTEIQVLMDHVAQEGEWRPTCCQAAPTP